MKIFFSALISLSFLSSSAASESKVENIPLTVGIFKDVPLSDVKGEISTGGTYKNCARVSFNDKTKVLRVNPTKEGFCTLVIKLAANDKVLFNFTLDSKKTDLNKVVREIRELLKEVEGIEIKIANSRVVVDGQVLLPAEIGRIHTVVKQYGDLATSLVTLSPIAQQKIAQFIERAIGNPEVRVKSINGKYILEGVVESDDDKSRAYTIAQTYVPDVVIDEPVADRKIQERQATPVINLLTVRAAAAPEPSKMVQVVVHYVELQKDYSKGFRFQWTPDLKDDTNLSFTSGGRGPAGLTSTITGTISNLLPKLNWAKEHGHARVLQSSSIIVEDGKPGILNSFQKIPFQTATETGALVTSFADAGIKTTVTPAIVGSRSDSVNLKLSFSISSLIGMSAAGPLTSQREIQTEIVVRSSQSAAVGGLISSDTATGYNKLPANASTNPIISLYASKDFRKNQSQFVVFVTPLIKASASAGSEAIKQKFRLRD
jgi:pilus assembly protein CpaC